MRHLVFLSYAVVLLLASPVAAQLIPWTEPPALDASTNPVPASARPEPARRRAAPPKKSPAEAIALAVPPSPEPPLLAQVFQSLTTPSEILLSSFDPLPESGGVRTGTSWTGNITQHATSITVAGTALDDNGWGASGLSLNATGMNSLTITAQRDAGNLAPTLFVQFEDRSSRTKVLSVSTSLFAVGTPTTVQLPLTGWTIDFGANDISAWSIGGGSVGTVAFRMTFDEFGLSASAIPEPATVALLSGLAALGVVAYRRRSSPR